MRPILAAACAVLLGCAGASSDAQTAPVASGEPPCSASDFRQMDFWLGDWDVRWEASATIPEGRGVNRITRGFDNCVIIENFTGDESTGNLVGHSVSTYHAPSQRWRQTWVDNQGGYFALIGGADGENRFVLVSHRLRDNAPVQRMVFEDISVDAFTWRWQTSTDGGANWSNSWTIFYTRHAD